MGKKKKKYQGRVWIGFDLGGTKMLAKVFNDDYQTLGRAKQKTHGAKGAKSGLARMVETIEEALDDAGVEADAIAGIGVGCPGPINPGSGRIVEAPNLGWRNVPVEEHLADAFDARVETIRDTQERKARDLTNQAEVARTRFFERAAPILLDIVRARGAAVLMDSRSVLLSAETVDITEDAIDAIDDRLGDGGPDPLIEVDLDVTPPEGD